MKKETKEIVKLSTKEILLSLFDLPFTLFSVFDNPYTAQSEIGKYLENRSIERASFFQSIQYLKRKGLIRTFVESNKRYAELTPAGQQYYIAKRFENLVVPRPSTWDGLFRVVIFDIPENRKSIRDIFRRKIESLGFKQIQKSVFVYPFECKPELDIICQKFSTGRYLKYMIAEIIEGEDEIIDRFIESGILELKDLDIKK
jgi:DNA-binding transcriptional regulator PaaX